MENINNAVTANDIIRSKFDLVEHIKNTKLSGKMLDRAIQIMLISACAHAHNHGDYGLINDTIDAVNAGARVNAAREFALKFGPVNWNEKKKVFLFAKSKREENFEESELFATMLATDWTTLKKEPPFRPVDLQTLLTSALKKAQEALADDENRGKHKVSESEIQSLEILLNNMEQARQLEAARKVQEELAREQEQETVVTETVPA